MRFSVAVYLGLLLAGAVIAPEPIVADADELTTQTVRLPWAQRAAPGDARHDDDDSAGRPAETTRP